MHFDKEKYGNEPWTKLEKPAVKELFLRDPPPVNPDFNVWFDKKFPNVTCKMVKILIYKTIFNSARNQETPLAHTYLKNMLNLINDEENTVKSVIDQLSKALNVKYSDYSHKNALARNIQIDQKLALSIQKEWSSFNVKKYDEIAISPITGESIHEETYQKVITNSKDCIKHHIDRKYKKENPELHTLVNYLNKRKVPQIISDRLSDLIETVDPVNDSLRYERLCSVKSNLLGGMVWQVNDQGFRVFTQGESLTTLSRSDRWSVMKQEDGFYEIDLTNAHFAILAHLINGIEMNKMLDNGSIWPQFLNYLNLDNSNKDRIKQCIYSILYGSAGDMQKLLLIKNIELKDELKQLRIKLNNQEKLAKTAEEKQLVKIEKQNLHKRIADESTEEDKNIYQKLVNHPAIKELLEGSKNLENKIIADGYFIDAFNNKHQASEFRGIGKIFNTIMTSYEKVLLMPIYIDAYKTKYFQVIIDQHDGMTLDFSHNIKGDAEVRKNILNKLADKVNQKAQKLNLKIKLEVKQ